MSAITLTGLFGLSGFHPYWGLLPMALIFVAIMFVSMFTSHYLNLITESHQRATVLSFKGMAFNLAYGLNGVLFALSSCTLQFCLRLYILLIENNMTNRGGDFPC